MGLLHVNGPEFRINGKCRTQRPPNRDCLCAVAIPCKSRASLPGSRFSPRKTTRNLFPTNIYRQYNNSDNKSLTTCDPHKAAGKTPGLSPNSYRSEAVWITGFQPENGPLILNLSYEMQITPNRNLAGSVKSLKNQQSRIFNDCWLRIPRSGF